jgi:ABC-type multidrug transport system ATPase subunit
MAALVDVSHLTKRFGAFEAVSDLSFAVQEGDVFGFLGQNGAGKSTTIRMLLSLVMPTSGTIRLFGKDLGTHRAEVLRRTGAIIESPDLYPYLTGFENLRLFSRVGGIRLAPSSLMHTLDLVGLSGRANDRVRTYSQGMKQRLGIAVALVQDPDLVILDEPTNGLDPQGIVDIRNLILSLNRTEGKTFLVSSHLLSEVDLIANRMLIIDRGRKVAEGLVRELIDPDRVMLDIETTEPVSAGEALRQSRWADAMRPAGPGRILLDIPRDEVPHVAEDLVAKGVGIRAMKPVNTLEAYFLSLTNTPEDVDAGRH